MPHTPVAPVRDMDLGGKLQVASDDQPEKKMKKPMKKFMSEREGGKMGEGTAKYPGSHDVFMVVCGLHAE